MEALYRKAIQDLHVVVGLFCRSTSLQVNAASVACGRERPTTSEGKLRENKPLGHFHEATVNSNEVLMPRIIDPAHMNFPNLEWRDDWFMVSHDSKVTIDRPHNDHCCMVIVNQAIRGHNVDGQVSFFSHGRSPL